MQSDISYLNAQNISVNNSTINLFQSLLCFIRVVYYDATYMDYKYGAPGDILFHYAHRMQSF